MDVTNTSTRADNKSTPSKGFYIIAIVFFAFAIYGIYSAIGIISINEIKPELKAKQEIKAVSFSECPVTVGGYIDQSATKTTLKLSFHNQSENTIGAIKFLVKSFDVYGKEIYDAKSYIYQEYYIDAGKSKSVTTWLPNHTKSVSVYVYSVYYKDDIQAEWGVRQCSIQTALLAPCFVFKNDR